MFDEVTRRRIAARVPALWPPGPYALAAAAARAIDAMSGRSRRLASAFVAPDDSAGMRRRAAAMPVRFDARGIAEVVAPSLTTADRVALENAVLL
jgi:malate/lactate dehydrogenase